jgi:PAS domain S-box-containing protein
MSDASGRCLHLNRMLREFWGVDDDKFDAFDWRITMHPDDVDRISREMWDALIARKPVLVNGRYRNAAGEYRVLQTDARPRFSSDGEFLGMLGVNLDMTERERADAQRELLLAELNHRVKNTLAVVQAVAHQTFRGDARSDAFDGRLLALAAAHNHLTEANWENAPLGDIVADALQTRGENRERVHAQGARVLLKPKAAVAIAMALHELGTNALKYGALSNGEGTIEIAWGLAGDGLRLIWQERGGPPVEPPSRRGFGSLLLQRTLAQDLGGKVDLAYDRGGVRCVIDIPMSLVSAVS